jgi:hypothetical protein
MSRPAQRQSFYGTPGGISTDYTPASVISKRAPMGSDNGYPLGQIWVNEISGAIYGLSRIVSGNADWEILGSSTGSVSTLTADSGGAISPVSGNITLSGTANQITSAGTAGDITFSLPAAIVAPGSLTTTTTLTGGTGITATTGDITATAGNVVLTAEGTKINHTSVATTTAAGANSIGSVTLVAGTATVATTAVTANSLIKIWRQSIGATGAAATGNLSVGTITAGTSFVITAVQPADATAAQASDVSVVGWEIVN